MNKKAWFVLTFIAFLAVGSLVAFRIWQSERIVQGEEVRFIGEKALGLMTVQLKSTDDLFLLDQGVRLAAYESVFDLAFKGGHRKESECGLYEGYNLWSNSDKRCFPTKSQLENDFLENFKFNFIKYRSLLQKRGLLVSYEYFYDDGSVIGVADTKWMYNKSNLLYKINPSFREKIAHDLGVYTYVQEFIDSLDVCNDFKKASIEQCIGVRMRQITIKYPDIRIFINKCGSESVEVSTDFVNNHHVKFCAEILDEKFPVLESGSGILKNPEILFAVTLDSSNNNQNNN
ncbi:MAG: hypothetical protein U9R08_05535 [Nanoarchaeota archaeon]|nr:hypothetical protein [Nanoarchaeota archaeon]